MDDSSFETKTTIKKNRKYTKETFIAKSKEAHGDRFDYSFVREVNGIKTRVTLVCNRCGYKFETSVKNNISPKSGCNSCSNRVKWTMDRFIEKGKEIHKDRFDYSLAQKD